MGAPTMNDLPTTTLGRTGAEVTKLGYGAMELRGPGGTFGRGRPLDDAEIDQLLNGVLDAGINIIDTSPDYGDSEEHIGRCISGRRGEYFLASKCGCPVGQPAATGPGPGSTSLPATTSAREWSRACAGCAPITS